MSDIIYSGERILYTRYNVVAGRRTNVYANGVPLVSYGLSKRGSLSLFDWGYVGVRPINLGISLLIDYYQASVDFRYCEKFTKDVISLLPDRWEFSSARIDYYFEWLFEQEDNE